MADVTQLLSSAAAGDPHAAAELLPLVYDELRKLAAARMAEEKPGQTLQATALVHEAYLRLVGGDAASQWNGRGHFFAAAAEAMRRILVENARRKQSGKRRRRNAPGGARRGRPGRPAGGADGRGPPRPGRGPAAVRGRGPAPSRLVKLRYFAGLSIPEAAAALGISVATAKRHWVYARAWLYGKLRNR